MYHDDRLATVLRTRTTGAVVARVQFRQLVDLLGTLAAEAHGPQLDAAYIRLAQLCESIPANERAAIVADPGIRLRAPRLVSWLAECEPDIAAAAMRKAQLRPEEWLDLIPALSVRARGLARLRRGLGAEADALLTRLGIHERGLPPSDAAAHSPVAAPTVVAPADASDNDVSDDWASDDRASDDRASDDDAHDDCAPASDAAPAATSGASMPAEGIGAIVRRIEDYRRQRARPAEARAAMAPDAPAESEVLPLDGHEPLRAFDFAADAEGRIVWSDPGVAPMAVGQCIAGTLDARSSAIETAIRRRQPIRAVRTMLDGAPAIVGSWQIDAAPVFESQTGRFTGYRGRFRRPAPADGPHADSDSEADRMRQLLHELRTPINAIQGFAEIIQQELFGPAPHEYRALASSIVADSARILGGFDELDRLARLGSGDIAIAQGECDLAAIVRQTIAQLDTYTSPRSSGFRLGSQDAPPNAPEHAPLPIAIAASDGERLVWRLLATLAANMGPGEHVDVTLLYAQDAAGLVLQLPATLAARSDDALFYAVAAQQHALSAGMFGTGFALRLASAELRSAGGTFAREGGSLRLTLPLPARALTEVTPSCAQDAGADEQPSTATSA